MKRATARLLTRLYPRAWRQRYGEEFEALLEDEHGNLRATANIVLAAAMERLAPTLGGTMDPYTFGSVSRKPTAFIPLAMSGAALLLLAGVLLPMLLHHHAIIREHDEGGPAHLWQLLMSVQIPVILFFAVKWLGRAPRQAMQVLALQACAWLAACAPVYLMHL